jgi:hypothetical protein
MADVEYGYKCLPRRITRFDEVPGCDTCLGRMYLEEHLQAALSELNSMRLAVKLLYSDSNTAYPASEVGPPFMHSHDEVSASNVGQNVKPSHYKMRKGAGEMEVSHTTKPILTSNRYDVLSNLSEYEHSVQLQSINGTTDLVISSATKLWTKSL